jgi:hypothetical protein
MGNPSGQKIYFTYWADPTKILQSHGPLTGQLRETATIPPFRPRLPISVEPSHTWVPESGSRSIRFLPGPPLFDPRPASPPAVPCERVFRATYS